VLNFFNRRLSGTDRNSVSGAITAPDKGAALFLDEIELSFSRYDGMRSFEAAAL